VLLHASGLHGVEAFAGSAVQLAALGNLSRPPAGCALVLAHVLNPYGMAWRRRVNENNVDLNRNFLLPGERWEGAPALYAGLDPLLNPSTGSPPGAFRLQLALFALRHGPHATRQAIAEGQYRYPRGLFYGGAGLEAGPRLFLDWLRAHLSRATRVLALDMHTGLGRYGGEMVIREPGVGATPRPELERALGRRLVDPAQGAAYRIRGGMGGALPHALPGARVDFLLQEIGTAPTFTVLRTLREENWYHHRGILDARHPSRLALLEALNPATAGWRRRALVHGLTLLHEAAQWLFGGSDDMRTVQYRGRGTDLAQ